jgi:hypothetical protein
VISGSRVEASATSLAAVRRQGRIIAAVGLALVMAAEVVAAVPTLREAQQALEPFARAAIDVAFVDVRLNARKGDQSGLGVRHGNVESPSASARAVSDCQRAR